jgi:hypothetical protein
MAFATDFDLSIVSSPYKKSFKPKKKVTYPKQADIQLVLQNECNGLGVQYIGDLELASGDFICHYFGEMRMGDESDELEPYSITLDTPDVFEDSEVVIDAARQGSLARFINQSHDPNCYYYTEVVGNSGMLGVAIKVAPLKTIKRGTLCALCDILTFITGDILSTYYAWEQPEDGQEMPCNCNSHMCTGSLFMKAAAYPKEEHFGVPTSTTLQDPLAEATCDRGRLQLYSQIYYSPSKQVIRLGDWGYTVGKKDVALLDIVRVVGIYSSGTRRKNFAMIQCMWLYFC